MGILDIFSKPKSAPPVAVYQKNGRSSIAIYGDYSLGNYPAMPYYNVAPMIGIPRRYNTAILRNVANSPWVAMAIHTIATEISNTPWKIVGDEKVEEFFKFPNTNGETFNELLYKLVKDYFEIGDGLFVKVFQKGVYASKSFNLSYDKYYYTQDGSKVKEITGFEDNIKLKSRPATLKKVVIKAPVNKGGLYEIYVPDASKFLINLDRYGRIPTDEPAYWQYATNFSSPKPFFRREVVWIRNMPRSDSPYGWAPVLNLIPIVETLEGGTRFNQKIFTNMSRPDAIVTIEGADKTTVERATNFWKDRFAQNPHKILFVGEKHEVTKLNMTNQDMEWLEGQKFYMKIVWALLGVTSDELGFSDVSNRLTGPHQSRVFIRKTIKPILNKIEEAINTQIIPELTAKETKFKFEYDDEYEKEVALNNNLNEIKTGTLTINEYRKSVGRDPVPWGDEPIRQNLIPFQAPNYEKAIKSTRAVLKKKIDLSKIKDLEDFFFKYFKYIGEEAIRLLDYLGVSGFLKRAKDLFSISPDQDKMFELLRREYDKGVDNFERNFDINIILENEPNIRELSKSLVDGMTMPDGTKWYGIRGTNEKLADDIIQSVREGVSKGESIPKLRDRVLKKIDVTKSRAAMIARTEAARFQNIGELDAAIKSGLKLKKEWVAVIDNRTCPICKRLNGQERELYDKFEDPETGLYMTGPVHPNCRCYVKYKIDGEEE